MTHVIEIPVRHMAQGWRQHAQVDGVAEDNVEITARLAVRGHEHAGYRPAFYVPSSGELVVIVACEPHRYQWEAIDWLRWMLEQLHHNGNITLYRDPEAACA